MKRKAEDRTLWLIDRTPATTKEHLQRKISTRSSSSESTRPKAKLAPPILPTRPKSKSPQVQVAPYYQLASANSPHRNTDSPHIRDQRQALQSDTVGLHLK